MPTSNMFFRGVGKILARWLEWEIKSSRASVLEFCRGDGCCGELVKDSNGGYCIVGCL